MLVISREPGQTVLIGHASLDFAGIADHRAVFTLKLGSQAKQFSLSEEKSVRFSSVSVKLLEITDFGRVVIGIAAPSSVRIVRPERGLGPRGAGSTADLQKREPATAGRI